MTQIKRIPTSAGDAYVEVSTLSLGSEGYAEASALPVSENLLSSLALVRPIADAVAKQLGSLAIWPDETSCEIGIGFSIEGTAFIAAGKAEANITVTLVWKRPA